jgi:hypothetical protein
MCRLTFLLKSIYYVVVSSFFSAPLKTRPAHTTSAAPSLPPTFVEAKTVAEESSEHAQRLAIAKTVNQRIKSEVCDWILTQKRIPIRYSVSRTQQIMENVRDGARPKCVFAGGQDGHRKRIIM